MSSSTPITISDVKQIDLHCHGLIEASAGTGKTYTIESLVIRLLIEQPALSLDNILLVTYTEKVASELKIRIREKIEAELRKHTESAATNMKLAEALEQFDAAPIQTIHGFCHTLLKDFSFENSSLFQTEVVDDRPLYDKALKAQMRTTWPKRYGHLLPQLLSLSGFTRNSNDYLNTIVAIAAGGFHPEAGDRLHPDPNVIDFKMSIEAFAAAAATLASLAAGTGFSDGYGQLNFNARSRNAMMQKIVIPLETWLQNNKGSPPDLIGFADLLATMGTNSRFRTKGPSALKPDKYNGNRDNSHEACPQLNDVVAALAVLVEAFNVLKHLLATESIVALREEVARRKRLAGLISYDDMLKRVYAALIDPGSERLLDRMRRRFRYAFVDEFQDTDPIQWHIFERIFLQSDRCRLFLIGDPKQAIYSFRGADVYTYFAARFQMGQLARQGAAQLYALDINFRSKADLVEGFNQLFADAQWFDLTPQPGYAQISYAPAKCAQANQLPLDLVSDRSDRAPFNLVDLRGPHKPREAFARLTRFIAAEINHLRFNSDIVIQSRDEELRPLHLGDIAILIRGQTNLPQLEEALSAGQIPYSYYLKPGLFGSNEAAYVSYLLNAIEDPARPSVVKKALLTPFFEWRAQDLYAYDELPPRHPIRRFFSRWRALALERCWGELFQSIMTDTGLIYRCSAATGWDRSGANYNQIITYLNDAAYRNNFDFARMCAHLEGLRRQTLSADESGDIHEIETERHKVQILTMHQAKGLQFPIVFIAGGLTRGSRSRFHSFHPQNTKKQSSKIVDLTGTVNPAKFQQELGDEEKRLYYVALTRAQLKLYVPFYPAPSNHPIFGPVCHFVARSISNAWGDVSRNDQVVWLQADIKAHTAKELDTTPQDNPSVADVLKTPAPEAFIPANPSFTHRSTQVESFSSIHAKQTIGVSSQASYTSFKPGRLLDRENDEKDQLADALPFVPTRMADEIPGGAEVGSMFHAILEQIDFQAVVEHATDLFQDHPTVELIQQQMGVYNLDLTYLPHVVQVIVDALVSPIHQINPDFCLGDLSLSDRLHEIAFYYSLPSSPNRYIRGVVDLVFRHGDRYYIADWKSNRLDDGYGQSALAGSMAAAEYHLQYRLYAVAVLRWFTQIMGAQFNPIQHFGGVFYFYIRGMGYAPGNGIYYIAPNDIGSLQSLESAVVNINKGPVD